VSGDQSATELAGRIPRLAANNSSECGRIWETEIVRDLGEIAYTTQLRYLVSTENQSNDALPKMIDGVTDTRLKQAPAIACVENQEAPPAPRHWTMDNRIDRVMLTVVNSQSLAGTDQRRYFRATGNKATTLFSEAISSLFLLPVNLLTVPVNQAATLFADKNRQRIVLDLRVN